MTTIDSSKIKYQAIVNKAYEAFFSPAQYEKKSSDQAILERGKTYRLPCDEGELAVTTWGEQGPSILLMHGWGGSRAQMTGFVEPLLSKGYRVIAYDQPAHGESDGKTTTLLKIAPTMHIINKKEGNFDCIIAHSFGTLIASYALAKLNFPPPAKLVYFGAFNRLLDSLPRFQVMANLPDEIMTGFQVLLNQNFGKGILEAIVHEELVKQIDIPALMFHDTADNVTPVEDSRAVAKVWKTAKFIETNGLGHRGALQSEIIMNQVIDFLSK